MIVSGLDRLLVQVLDLLPVKSQKVLYWIARVIKLPHLWVGSCGALVKGLAWCQLASELPSEWSTQRGRSLPASK